MTPKKRDPYTGPKSKYTGLSLTKPNLPCYSPIFVHETIIEAAIKSDTKRIIDRFITQSFKWLIVNLLVLTCFYQSLANVS